MPNIKSQKKRVVSNEQSRQRNVAVKSRLKTFVKTAMEAVESKDADKVKAALPATLSEIDKAAAKGVIHPNTAARKKSFLQRQAGK